MDKIFRRDTLVSDIRIKKKEEKKRKRNIVVNFRVTPEEKRLLDNRIELSGLMKREFFIQSCLRRWRKKMGKQGDRIVGKNNQRDVRKRVYKP